MPYAYLGPEGTFSEAALRAVDPDAAPLSCPTIQAALAAVREGAAERAVVPIESSVEVRGAAERPVLPRTTF